MPAWTLVTNTCTIVVVLEQLTTAIDGLSEIDWRAVDAEQAQACVFELRRRLDRLEAVAAAATSAWDACGEWSRDGSKSAGARLARECGVAAGTARRLVRRARALRSMPSTAAALVAGNISVDVVDVLVRANQPALAGLFARDEHLLVEQAGRLRFAELTRVITYWRHCADDQGAEARAAHQHEARSFSAVRTFADTVDLQGILDPVAGGIFLAELHRIEQRLFAADWSAARIQHGGLRPPTSWPAPPPNAAPTPWWRWRCARPTIKAPPPCGP